MPGKAYMEVRELHRFRFRISTFGARKFTSCVPRLNVESQEHRVKSWKSEVYIRQHSRNSSHSSAGFSHVGSCNCKGHPWLALGTTTNYFFRLLSALQAGSRVPSRSLIAAQPSSPSYTPFRHIPFPSHSRSCLPHKSEMGGMIRRII